MSCTHCQNTYKPEFESFKRDFIDNLQIVGMHQVKFSSKHFSVLEKLRHLSLTKNFLPKSEFDELCQQQDVPMQGELNQEWLLDLLDKLGVIIHFPRIRWLKDFLLNPRWLTYGIYTLLYAEKTQRQQGQITLEEVVEILTTETVPDNLDTQLNFPADRCHFIAEAMEQFKLSYRLPNDRDTLIIPALLCSDTPELTFDKTTALAFDFDFEGFLPRHLIAEFIVEHHEEIVDDMVWQNGVQLRSHFYPAEALAQVDYRNYRFSLWVKGDQTSRYFSVLYNEIKKRIARMPDLPCDEYVGLAESARIGNKIASHLLKQKPRADFQDLLAKEARGEREHTCKFGRYDLAKVLKIMPVEERRERQGKTINNYFNIEEIGEFMNEKITGNINQTITHSTVGVGINLGKMSGDVKILIDQLPTAEPAQAELKETLAQLRVLIDESNELKDEDKGDALEQVGHLVKAAENPQEQGGLVRTALRFFKGLADDYQNAIQLKQELLIFVEKIKSFF